MRSHQGNSSLMWNIWHITGHMTLAGAGREQEEAGGIRKEQLCQDHDQDTMTWKTRKFWLTLTHEILESHGEGRVVGGDCGGGRYLEEAGWRSRSRRSSRSRRMSPVRRRFTLCNMDMDSIKEELTLSLILITLDSWWSWQGWGAGVGVWGGSGGVAELLTTSKTAHAQIRLHRLLLSDPSTGSTRQGVYIKFICLNYFYWIKIFLYFY